jgi:Mg2+/Co2+ transporter CorB
MLRSRLLSRVDTRDRDAAFALAILSYALFSVLDVMTTIVALGRGLHERSALGASLYMQYGAAGLWVAKAALVGVIVAVLAVMPRRVAVWVGTVFAVWTALAVVGNLHALH